MAVAKGTKNNPHKVVVRQESTKNRTLSITLSKNIIELLGDGETGIKKGDVLAEWVDPTSKTIYLRKVSPG